jgi:hypothetical protein
MNHLTSNQHKDEWLDCYKALTQTSSASDTYDKYKSVSASSDAKAYFGWIELIIENNYPFEYVENRIVKKYTNLPSVSSKTIKKYIGELSELVSQKVKAALPSRFGLILDGWSNGTSDHVVAVFATCSHECGAFTILLGINELDDPTNQNAANHVDYIKKLLEKVGKDSKCIDFLVGDNTNLNPAIARNLGVPFIGCYSHKLNLAVKAYQDGYSVIIRKVEEVMIALRTNNNFGILKEYCREEKIQLRRPQLANVTRWSSTYVMLKRYLELHGHLSHTSFGEINFMLLTAEELKILRELMPIVDDLNVATKALQREAITLLEARIIFDAILEKYKDKHRCFNMYLDKFHTSNFENGIIKMLRNDPLNQGEFMSVRHFRIQPSQPEETPAPIMDENGPELSVMDIVERELKRQRTETISTTEVRYKPVYHIAPTSNICERLFSQAKIVYSDRRKSMKLNTFEMLLFLKVNKQYWNVRSIDEIINSNKVATNHVDSFFEDDEPEFVHTLREVDEYNLMRVNDEE